MDETTVAMCSAYVALLSIPQDDSFRYLNQDIYARMRDAIAFRVECAPEYVQTTHEELAAELVKNG